MKRRGKRGESGTCGVGAGEVWTGGVEEDVVVGRRRVHAGDKTKLGRPGGTVP